MTEQTQQTVDSAGITRTAEGAIATNGSTTPPSTPADSSSQNTTPQATNGRTLLTETEPAAPAADATAKPDDGAKPPQAAPEKYEEFKVPENFVLDPKVKAEIEPKFKAMNLSQEQAQELVDTYVKHTEEARQAPFKAYQDLTDKWRQEASDHPDLRGRLGAGKEVTVRIARALDGIGDSELASQFRELMDLTGAGNHPAFIRVLDKFARQLTEGNAVQPGNRPSTAGQSRSGDTSPPSAAGAMWPHLKSSMNR